MKKIIECLVLCIFVSVIAVSCSKKPITLDDSTPMKALLKASDEEISELVVKEAAEKGDINPEDISVKYILRDKQSQTIVVKSKIKQK